MRRPEKERKGRPGWDDFCRVRGLLMETEFKSYQTLSPAVKAQISRVAGVWSARLGDFLIGVYLHGSIALGRFAEENSDIDILIVSGRRIKREERLAIAREMMEIDGQPSPLEMSAIFCGDLMPWKYPTPCQFHYSDFWTERYRMMLSGELKESPIIDEDFEDPDIACHVRLTLQCGICIYGKTIKDVFPTVPEQDFWQSISGGVDEYDFHAYEPRYYTSNILTLGRILSYKKEQRILSKYDGGVWTLNHVPERFRYIIEDALKVWYAGAPGLAYQPEDIRDLRQFLLDEIKR